MSWRAKLFPPVPDGSGHRRRYHQPFDTPPRLYLPPGLASALVDPARALVVTEGEKVALASTQAGHPALALGGLWNFLENGDPLDALGTVDWTDRPVTIAPDSDVWVRDDLKRAVVALTVTLTDRGARVVVLKLPARPEGGKVGLDNFLVASSTDALATLPRLPLDHKTFSDAREWWKAHRRGRALAVAEELSLSDLGNARRFVRDHHKELRYVAAWKHWRVWDGRRWAEDATGEAIRRAMLTIRGMYRDAAEDERSATPRKELARHALQSEGERRLRAMVALASVQSELVATPDMFDQHPWLLNVDNGTLDLRTAQLRPHDPADYLTRVIRVSYDPDATCPQWLAFLTTIFGGQHDVIDFMQASLGYALTGTVGEQALFVLHGSGANGKSTLLRAVFDLLDGYAQVVRSESLMVRRGDTIPNDLATLAGARCVIASEAEEGQRFAESLVKGLTGQDVITARFLHCEYFTFIPQFKLFIAVNHRPIIRGTEKAIWRRIRLVPFGVTIPDDCQDRALGDKLRAEQPGILAWAVTGCLRWQQDGRLVAPDAVRTATESYRAAMDHLGDWLTATCRLAPDLSAPTGVLYKSYEDWCRTESEKPLSAKAFGLRLTEREFRGDKDPKGKRVRFGLRLLEPGETPTSGDGA